MKTIVSRKVFVIYTFWFAFKHLVLCWHPAHPVHPSTLGRCIFISPRVSNSLDPAVDIKYTSIPVNRFSRTDVRRSSTYSMRIHIIYTFCTYYNNYRVNFCCVLPVTTGSRHIMYPVIATVRFLVFFFFFVDEKSRYPLPIFTIGPIT